IIDTTRAQQHALDDELVAPTDRLKIGKSNLRLRSILKSKEPTLQVALDALKLTPFYNAFEISDDVPEIYMQEDMLKICPKLPGQIFKEPPLEEEILSFIRDLGHTGEIKFLSDVNVNHMHQPWRSFASIINKCLSGKTTALENLVYKVENKNSKKNNDMYYPRFTKVIVDYFMAKDRAILRRNKMFWHYARDDFMFTTIRVISKHQDTQVYGAILPQHLTNQTMLVSEAYKTYLAYATGEKIPKPKYVKNKADSESSPKKKTATTAKGKRLKTLAKAAKPANKKQPAKKSKAKVAHDADNQDDDDQEDDGQDDEDQDDVNEQTNSDNDGDDFVHPKLSTQDQDVRHNEEESDEEIQGANVEEEELDKEETNDEDEANELYRDMNVNLEGRDIEMTDAKQTNVQTTQVIEDTYVIITSVNPEGQQQSSSVSSGFISNMLNLSPETEFKQMNQFAAAVSLIHGIVDMYLANKMNEAVKTTVQLQLDRLRDEAQAKNEDFLNKLDDNIKKIIKDQVKEQVKAQTSHAVAANLYELELKKILIDKMESKKSIHRSDEQKNLYKALVDAYESDKLILDTYEDNVSFKRQSTSALKEKTSKTTGKSTEGSKSHHKSAGESVQAEEPRHTAKDLEEPAHLEFET
ncbi:hypothetical protein Tco_0691404, partial [Tanacetum coccineum]